MGVMGGGDSPAALPCALPPPSLCLLPGMLPIVPLTALGKFLVHGDPARHCCQHCLMRLSAEGPTRPCRPLPGGRGAPGWPWSSSEFCQVLRPLPKVLLPLGLQQLRVRVPAAPRAASRTRPSPPLPAGSCDPVGKPQAFSKPQDSYLCRGMMVVHTARACGEDRVG